jgi:hypothetical protein
MPLTTLPKQIITSNDWELVLNTQGYIITNNSLRYAFGDTQPNSTIGGVKVSANTRIDNPDGASLWLKKHPANKTITIIKHGFM